MRYVEVNQFCADEFEIAICDDATPQGVAVVAGKQVAIVDKKVSFLRYYFFVSPLGLPVVCNLIEEQKR